MARSSLTFVLCICYQRYLIVPLLSVHPKIILKDIRIRANATDITNSRMYIATVKNLILVDVPCVRWWTRKRMLYILHFLSNHVCRSSQMSLLRNVFCFFFPASGIFSRTKCIREVDFPSKHDFFSCSGAIEWRDQDMSLELRNKMWRKMALIRHVVFATRRKKNRSLFTFQRLLLEDTVAI